MSTSIQRRLAAGTLAGTGVIHLALAGEYLAEQAYIGGLFIVGGVAALIGAVALFVREDARAWALGALISAGMAVGFVLSRTIGLPGFHEADWEPSGLLSLALEGGFLALAAAWFSARRSGRRLAAG